MWERWNSWTKDNGFGDPEMNSFNHYAYGAVGDWFFETVCGIQPESASAEDAGFKRFRLAPLPGKRLTSAAAEYHSSYGVIRSSWKRENGVWTWAFTVPCNTSAEVDFPENMTLTGGLPDGISVAGGALTAQPGMYVLTFAEDK